MILRRQIVTIQTTSILRLSLIMKIGIIHLEMRA